MRSDDRRRYPRFPHGSLAVTLHRAGLRGILAGQVQTRCLDYSRCGIGVITDRTLRVGERLIVDLVVAGVRADELVGVVASSSMTDGEPHSGIRFELDRLHRRMLTEHALCAIETCLCQQQRNAGGTPLDAA